jgi:hypothetical protein
MKGTTRWQLLAFLALLISCLTTRAQEDNNNNNNDPALTYAILKKAQQELNSKTDQFCYHGPSGTKNAFFQNSYHSYIPNQNVLVYPFCLMVRELGNRLGNYFHEVACAEASGLHFMTVHPQWDITGAITGNSTKIINRNNPHDVNSTLESRLAFLRALPDVIVNPHPLDRTHATNKLNHECKCSRYCRYGSTFMLLG